MQNWIVRCTRATAGWAAPLVLVLGLVGCATPALTPWPLLGRSGVQDWDRSRYTPTGTERDKTYFACLNETAGQGREPFDVCMRARGFTR